MVDDLNPPALAQLPDGFVITKKGGRPRKEARDAAVFLAHHWRMVNGDSATKAADWIIEHWEALGSDASKGISEPAHIRACIRRANQRGLNDAQLMQLGDGGPLAAFEIGPNNGAFGDGVRTWFWAPSMEIAAEGRIKDFQVTVEQEVHHPSPIALAVSSFITRLG